MSLVNKYRNKNKNAFKERLNYLNNLGRDISIYEDGVNEVIDNIKNKKASSLVVYGEPQSGKTEAMIALVCKLMDEGYKTIFIIMNDNTELETQNFQRFQKAQQINPSPITAEQFINFSDEDKRSDIQRVIFCRKNATNLRKLIEDGRFLRERVVIDDEADFATPDGKVNKDEDPSTINALVRELGNLQETGNGIYIGVTATPGRLDLNGTFANDSDNWVFLRSHDKYKGREFFFPVNEQQSEKSDYQLKIISNGEDKKHMIDAALRFFVRASIINCNRDDSGSHECFTMLIHTEGKTTHHEEDEKTIQKIISTLQNEKQPKADQYIKRMEEIARIEINKNSLDLTMEQILEFIVTHIGKSSTLIINHKKNKQNVRSACSPTDNFTFAFGGNIISRGLTFDKLLTFYFTRGVKGKLQQNTYIQRARMFGVREYSKYFELCVPQDLMEYWSNCFIEHEMSLESAKNGDYVHIASEKTASADSASIWKDRTIKANNEFSIGEIVDMPNNIEVLFSSYNKRQSLIEFIEKLISDNILSSKIVSRGFFDVIKQVSRRHGEEPILLLSTYDQFIYPGNYKDFNESTLRRDRAGLIAATIKGRDEFSGKQIIMPVKNKDNQMRLFYKNNLGYKVLKFMK
jgi:hypothetical protein